MGAETETQVAAEVPVADVKAAEPASDAQPEDAFAPKCTEKLASDKLEKKMKKVLKEGGKRGVEVEGSADMGGLKYMGVKVDEPAGDVDMLVESMKAMNAKCDPSEEERKGGSGKVGKLLVSSDTDCNKIAFVAYVPLKLQESGNKDENGEEIKPCTAKELLQSVLDAAEISKVVSIREDSNDTYAQVQVNKNMESEPAVVPLKFRDHAISYALNFLRKKGLFPEDDEEDDDEMVFGDEDFPSM